MKKEKINLTEEQFDLLAESIANLCKIASASSEYEEGKIIDDFIDKIFPHFQKYYRHYLLTDYKTKM